MSGWWWSSGALALLIGWAALQWARLPDAAYLRGTNPATTALIEQRKAEAVADGQRARVSHRWVPVDRIAATAVDAVLVSEDDAFFQHDGIDTRQLERVLTESWARGRFTRGASTLTQQLAKNLWLSTDRSLLRKAKELILARRLESALEKERILELYLNVVEWGDGVYGIEAAAHEHFGQTAAELTPGEAAILAAMLPAPRRWLPRDRPEILHARATTIVDRLERFGRLSRTAAAAARLEIDDRVGPAPAHAATTAPPEPLRAD